MESENPPKMGFEFGLTLELIFRFSTYFCVLHDGWPVMSKAKNLRIASFFVHKVVANEELLGVKHWPLTSVGKTSWMNSFYITIYQPEFSDFFQFPK